MLNKDDFERMRTAYIEALAEAKRDIDDELSKDLSKKIFSNNPSTFKEQWEATMENQQKQRDHKIKQVSQILEREIFQDWGGSLEKAQEQVPEYNSTLEQKQDRDG